MNRRKRQGASVLRVSCSVAEALPEACLDDVTLLHQGLQVRGIEHVWQIYPGIHEWTYWHEHAVDYLRFYGNALARQ